MEGEEKATSFPSWACHANCSWGTFWRFRVVSWRLKPVRFELRRNWGQLMSAEGAADAGKTPLKAAMQAAARANARTVLMVPPLVLVCRRPDSPGMRAAQGTGETLGWMASGLQRAAMR